MTRGVRPTRTASRPSRTIPVDLGLTGWLKRYNVTYGGRVAELVPITRANWRDAAAIRVGEGQLRFIADYEPVALVILSKAFVRIGDLDWWPYLVKHAGYPVGVLTLADERQRNGQIALFHLLIHADRQRSGHGRAALRLVIDLARQLDGCERLRLTVHPDNHAAIDLYRSEGFTDDGVDNDGELRLSSSVS